MNTLLGLYADDTTMYSDTADIATAVLEIVTNDTLHSLSDWFKLNYLVINPDKSQALILGPSKYDYSFLMDGASVTVSDYLKILGVTPDKKLSFKDHISLQLEKAYRMTAVLRRSRRFIPFETMKRLYKAHLLLGICKASQSGSQHEIFGISQNLFIFSRNVQ